MGGRDGKEKRRNYKRKEGFQELEVSRPIGHLVGTGNRKR